LTSYLLPLTSYHLPTPCQIERQINLAYRILGLTAQQLTCSGTFGDVVNSVIVTCAKLHIVKVKTDAAYQSIIPILETVAVKWGEIITQVTVSVDVCAYQVCPVRSRVNLNGIPQLEYGKNRHVDIMQIEFGFMVYDPKIGGNLIALG